MNRSNANVLDEIHFFILLDTSSSMLKSLLGGGSPIQALNEAMANLLPVLAEAAQNKEVTLYAHILSFNSNTSWLCGTSATAGVDVEQIKDSWSDLSAKGTTNTASAIRAILPGLSTDYLGHHTFRPIIVLITDGYSDDRRETQRAIAELNSCQKTTNIAIGVEGYKAEELEDFASTGKILIKDPMGNSSESENGKFIFPVQDSENLKHIVASAAVSSLLNAKLVEGDGEDKEKDDEPIIEITSNWLE